MCVNFNLLKLYKLKYIDIIINTILYLFHLR